jgi:hypothetical protein
LLWLFFSALWLKVRFLRCISHNSSLWTHEKRTWILTALSLCTSLKTTHRLLYAFLHFDQFLFIFWLILHFSPLYFFFHLLHCFFLYPVFILFIELSYCVGGNEDDDNAE